MKKIFNTKLVLNKQVVSSLNQDELSKIQGGGSASLECVPSYGAACPKTDDCLTTRCPSNTCPPTDTCLTDACTEITREDC